MKIKYGSCNCSLTDRKGGTSPDHFAWAAQGSGLLTSLHTGPDLPVTPHVALNQPCDALCDAHLLVQAEAARRCEKELERI